MKTAVFCLCFIFGIVAISAFPYNNYYGRARRTPYHRRPAVGHAYRREAYAPEEEVPAANDVIPPVQYPQDEFLPPEQVPVDAPLEEPLPQDAIPEEGNTEPTYIQPVEVHTEALPEAEPDFTTTVAPKKTNKRKQKPQKAVEDDDDDEDDDDEQSFFPFAPRPGRRGGSSSVFFPIVFGGYPGGRSRNGDEGNLPGVATAIANAFSTGRGGVARSHATAYGTPYGESYFRRNKGNKQE